MMMWRPLLALALALPMTAASGSTTVYTRFADASCTSVPKQVVFNVSSTACEASSSAACSSTTASGSSYYTLQSCAASVDAVAAAKSAFAASSSPYVLMEVYKAGASCSSDSLVSAVAFLADAKCLVVDNGESSVKASVNADGSALLETFSGTSCSGTATKSNAIASSSVAGKSCVNSAFKFYTSAVATTTISTGTSDSTRTGLSVATTLAVALVAASVIY